MFEVSAFASVLVDEHLVGHGHDTRLQDQMGGIQLQPLVLSKHPLDMYVRSFLGSIHNIWAKLPQDLLIEGRHSKWMRMSKKCKKFLKGQ